MTALAQNLMTAEEFAVGVILREGLLRLDPPGIGIALADVFK